MLLFALSCASGIKPVSIKSDKVKIAWDSPTAFTNGAKIPEGYKLGYSICISKKRGKAAKCSGGKVFVDSTNAEIPIPTTGQYFVGVQAFHGEVKDGIPILDPDQPYESRIAWSFNQFDTNNHPWCVKREQ